MGRVIQIPPPLPKLFGSESEKFFYRLARTERRLRKARERQRQTTGRHH